MLRIHISYFGRPCCNSINLDLPSLSAVCNVAFRVQKILYKKIIAYFYIFRNAAEVATVMLWDPFELMNSYL